MRAYRLSQDAQWALRYRAAHTRPRQKKSLLWGWLTFGLAAAILLIVAATLIVSCSTSVAPEPTTSTWQCISAPHIRIAFDSFDESGYGYFRTFVADSITECKSVAVDLDAMLKDGHWEQIETGEPLFLPPPSHWNSFVSDKLEWVKINGSDAMPMQTFTPLPDDKAITIEKEEEND